jgi:transposase-like protein
MLLSNRVWQRVFSGGPQLPWEVNVLLGQGRTVSQACKQIGISDQTYYRWRKSYGGMKVDQAKRLKELEAENAGLAP